MHIHRFFVGTGLICIGFSLSVCVRVHVCGCHQVPKPAQQQRRGNLDQTVTLTYCTSVSFPTLYVRRVDEPTRDLERPSPCGDFSLLTNLPFTGSPQMALLILPVFKYKRPPGTTRGECVYVCICHTAASRGLSQSAKTRLPFSIQVCF